MPKALPAATGFIRAPVRVPPVLPQNPVGRFGPALEETVGQIRPRTLSLSQRHVSRKYSEGRFSGFYFP